MTLTLASLFCRRASALGVALLFALIVSRCAAAPLYVSQDGNDNNSGTATSPYRTIQAAVNNANAGDTITLHASTFSGNGNRDIDFAGKSLTINSDSGAARTVIDCGGTAQEHHRAFYLHSKEKDIIFEGLTIKNSDGAINIGRDCTTQINKCLFTADTGGISNSGTATLTGCTFTGNSNGDYDGIYNGGTATLTGCTFTGNSSSSGGGGGIYNGGTATLTGCTFTGNSSGGVGGGGGGIYNGGTATLTNCIISVNTAVPGNGGGIYNGGKVIIRFCSISGNTAKTAADQQTPAQGGGLENDGTAILTDDVLWGNVAPNAAEIGLPANGGQTTTVNYCDIQGGLSGTGNIKSDPLFISSAIAIMPPLAVTNMGNANMHLQAGSPCRGAGITIGPEKPDPNQANNRDYKPDPGVSTDADGLHRPSPPSIGAYEYTANPPPVKKRPVLDIGDAGGKAATSVAPPTTNIASAPGAAGVTTTDVAVMPPAVAQARPVLGPGEQKQANDEFLHLMVSLDTNTLSHDEMTRQIQGELAKGAQLDARDSEGFPAIVTASSLKRTDVVQVLLELGADPNALTVQVSADASATDDSSILHKTANGYQVNVGAVVSSIFGHKSKPKPAYGQSALMYAAQTGSADMVTLLLNAKVVVNMRDSRGKSAVDYANDAHHDDVVATLKAHGAG